MHIRYIHWPKAGYLLARAADWANPGIVSMPILWYLRIESILGIGNLHTLTYLISQLFNTGLKVFWFMGDQCVPAAMRRAKIEYYSEDVVASKQASSSSRGRNYVGCGAV